MLCRCELAYLRQGGCHAVSAKACKKDADHPWHNVPSVEARIAMSAGKQSRVEPTCRMYSLG